MTDLNWGEDGSAGAKVEKAETDEFSKIEESRVDISNGQAKENHLAQLKISLFNKREEVNRFGGKITKVEKAYRRKKTWKIS